MAKIVEYLPLPRGKSRVDDRRVLSGIVFLLKNGLRRRVSLVECGPPKTLYNRFIRWSRMGVSNKVLEGLGAGAGEPDALLIDATHLKAYRTASSLLKRGRYPAALAEPKAG
jgi:putative transposase